MSVSPQASGAQVQRISPRPKQQEILEYVGGKMSILAVPGSGKTWTLSMLAAKIISQDLLAEGQEVLVVTLTNSAVDNFASRINAFLKQGKPGKQFLLLPDYKVCTLHSLSNDIVRQRPDLVNLAENFQIIDEQDAQAILNQAAKAWLVDHANILESYLKDDVGENQLSNVRRKEFPKLVSSIANSFIRLAKDMRLSAEELAAQLERVSLPLPLAAMGIEIYADYQRALAYRGAVDFDDLNRLALDALEQDPSLLERLQARWPYILEDEAQDSSRLQEKILETLAGPRGNWVRVGDPNQAIFESFTTADPKHLRDFYRRPDVIKKTLPASGRSTLSIIALANQLIRWTSTQHALFDARDALGEPFIEPVLPGSNGENPPDERTKIHLELHKYSPEKELQTIARSAQRWLAKNPHKTVAVLVPRNNRGFDLVDRLRNLGVKVNDSLLRSSAATRSAAGVLEKVLAYLADPVSARKLKEVYQEWRREEGMDPASELPLEQVARILGKCSRIEAYLWPIPGDDWLENLELDSDLMEELVAFRAQVTRWQEAILLPVDQLVLTVAQDLFRHATELALAHKLAVVLRQRQEANPGWRLPELTSELSAIAQNERRFLGFDEDATGFDPQAHTGEVVVTTMHKAKGLEWDRVYLMSVNNYNFPSGNEFDQYMSEKWFIRDDLNLEAETLAQMDTLFAADESPWYQEGQATKAARIEYIRERLRLFYVGITRAKEELIVTWNSGRFSQRPLSPADPLVALHGWWVSQTAPDEEA